MDEKPKKVINYVLTDIAGRRFIHSIRSINSNEYDPLPKYAGAVYTVVGRVYKDGRRSRLEGLIVAFGDGRQVTIGIEGCYKDLEAVQTQSPKII